VAGLVTDLAVRTRAATGLGTVVLGGGVFGNALLLSAARRRLEEQAFAVLSPEQLPANDGGLALGQLLVGALG
jgi:hydrogenase maturation protein HypF